MDIIKKPLITEKATALHEEGVYTFVVERKASKPEIKAAIEKQYGVKIESVNTLIQFGKLKSRYTKGGTVSGRKVSYKKALVKLKEGEFIDLYEGA